LYHLFEAKSEIIAYDGFEPSGRIHIAQGILKAINVNKLTRCGCNFVFWVADWFALMNNKMGGDLEKIKKVGRYMIEVWKAVGMDMRKVQFKWASDEIVNHSMEYWSLVLDIARRNNVSRIKRCGQIMGRSENEDLSAAQILYPCMQCADIFFLKADICQLGMDQRKVNMLAREYCDDIKRKVKPIILSHHMLMGLNEGQEKMSKSDPNSAIFMEDTESDVNMKIKRAFCPPGQVQGNPVLDYTKHIVFGKFTEFTVERKADNGGNITYHSYLALETDFAQGKLHPGDLKSALARVLNQLIQPVRDHFNHNPEALELFKQIESFKATR
jgi:tyrosyl-tRNA synthetase